MVNIGGWGGGGEVFEYNVHTGVHGIRTYVDEYRALFECCCANNSHE